MPSLYDSGLSDWTAAKMGPHRDVIGDLSKAVRAVRLHFGVSSHRVDKYGIANSFEVYEGTHTSKVADRMQNHVIPFFGQNLCF